MQAQTATPAPEAVSPDKYRRRDKLQLLIGALVASAIPVLLCWGLPNQLAQMRERDALAQAAAAQAAEEAFRTDYANLIALCDSEQEPVVSAQPPSDLSVLVVRNGHQADIQASLPEEWQPSGPRNVSVVICLSREAVRPVEVCAGGQVADLTAFEGYEIELLKDIYAQPGTVKPRDCIGNHPELSGQVMHRYATEAVAYDVATGAVMAFGTLWGDDAEVCNIEALSSVELNAEMLYGPRMTLEALVDGLAAMLGQ